VKAIIIQDILPNWDTINPCFWKASLAASVKQMLTQLKKIPSHSRDCLSPTPIS